jgi:2-polyprenyl-3-methyl-5-hydroxy-6-metoxy-1,4-benzoquinol methylase
MNCQNCGHVFLDCNFTPDQLSELYTHYYPRRNLDVAQYKPHTEAKGLSVWFNGLNSSSFRYVPMNVRVLDVGCGFGQSLGYHEARGCDVFGVEADENIRRVADKFGFRVHVGLFDDSIYKGEFFDYVTMDQVIEHVTDPVATLRGVARILKPGGTAVLSTPNASGWGARCFGRRWINWHAPYHLQFFTPRSMKMAGENAGLVVKRTMTVTSSEWLNFQWLHLLTYPLEGKPSVFWASRGTWNFMQRLVRNVLTMVHSCKIDHVITRVFDALDVGDNRIFFLRKP